MHVSFHLDSDLLQPSHMFVAAASLQAVEEGGERIPSVLEEMSFFPLLNKVST